MKSRNQSNGAYEVPTYEAPADAAWFHFLHGNVPGHQIDFIYRHAIPWGRLSRQHFGHLVRILQYIEPRDPREQAFAIGNLSRDDTQHEPGHGGIALVLSLRVHGARDHAGREDPSFSHAIVGVDREFDEDTFAGTALAFRKQLVESTRVTAEGVGFYHSYTSCGEDPPRAGALLRSYLADFDNLPAPGPSRLSLQWTAQGIVQPKRIVILHDDGLPFEALVRCAGRIAAILYTSNVRWTLISNGREEDLPNGTTIRFVPASVGALADEGVVVHRFEDMPADAEALALLLFQAKPVHPSGGTRKRKAWRDEIAAQGDEIEVAIDEAPPRAEVRKPAKRRSWRWFGMVLPLVAGGLCVAWFAQEQGTGQVVVNGPPVERPLQAPTQAPTQAPRQEEPQPPAQAPVASIQPTASGRPATPRAPAPGKTAAPHAPTTSPKPESACHKDCRSDQAECTTEERKKCGL
jgi:hypothetical protein